MKVPDKVSLADALAELKNRVKIFEHPMTLQPVIKDVPGHCSCDACMQERFTSIVGVSQRLSELHCQNNQAMHFCEKHAEFFHYHDTCPRCEDPPNWLPYPQKLPKEIKGYWEPAPVEPASLFLS